LVRSLERQAGRIGFGAGLEDIGPRGMRLVEGTGFEAGRPGKHFAVVVGHSSCEMLVFVCELMSNLGLPLLLLLVIWSYLLSMLEAAMSGCTILRILVAAVVLAGLLLRRVLGLLVSTLVIAALLRRVRAVALRRVLLLVVLLLAAVLVVLIVGTGHCECVSEILFQR
jgi:hypothetical protein